MEKMFLVLATFCLFPFSFSAKEKKIQENYEIKETSILNSKEGIYHVDVSKSFVNWQGFKFYEEIKEEAGHHGFFRLTSGKLIAKDGKLESGIFIIDVNSLENKDLEKNSRPKKALEEHLKSSDFLDVEKFPTAKFEMTKVTSTYLSDYTSIIEGNLTLKNITRNISFKANIFLTDEKIKISSKIFTINRKDFDVMYSGGHDVLIKDEVEIQIDIIAPIYYLKESVEYETLETPKS